MKLVNDFVESLVKEISLAHSFIEPIELIDTIYFGGGTPSILNADQLDRIMEALQSKFLINENAEVTLEANPDDITPAVLASWRKAGINRLSLGVQSFKEDELRWMNRAHSAIQSLRSIDEIKEAGFENFSIDLIFGSPLLSDMALEKNLGVIYEKKAPHISCYALTVEPRTVLNKLIAEKKSLPVNSDKQAEQFLILMNSMQKAGYEQYEISNFAMPGMRSKHNSSYWQGKPYYGFGPSAHSFNGENVRRWNIANNALYIKSLDANLIPFEEEVLTNEQMLNEYIMTALRTIEGINIDFLSIRFGPDASEKLEMEIKKFIGKNQVILNQGSLSLTNEGKLFADGIAAELFFST